MNDSGAILTDRVTEQETGAAPAALAAIQFLCWREIVRFTRQRSRMIGAFAQPLVFWLLLGGGFHSSFRAPGAADGDSYLSYFYPGIVVLTLLFTAIFATIAIVEDRHGGFLQGVLVAPVSRATIVLGQSLGCSLLAVLQGALVLLLAPLGGIHLGVTSVVAAVAVQFLIALGLTNLGLVIAWRMESTQGFHAVMNLFLIPLWLLSGAVFPADGAATVMGWVMALNPLTYGVALLRHCLHAGGPATVASLPGVWTSLAVMLAFAVVTHAIATRTAQRSGA